MYLKIARYLVIDKSMHLLYSQFGFRFPPISLCHSIISSCIVLTLSLSLSIYLFFFFGSSSSFHKYPYTHPTHTLHTPYTPSSHLQASLSFTLSFVFLSFTCFIFFQTYSLPHLFPVLPTLLTLFQLSFLSLFIVIPLSFFLFPPSVATSAL
jgi:hypothetical protein